MRHDQVQIRRPSCLEILVLCRHERRGGQRHQLPGKQECDHIGRDEHELDGEQQDVEGDAQEYRPPFERSMSRVTDAEDRNRQRQRREHDEKPRRERVDRVVERKARGVMDEEHTSHRPTGAERRGRSEARDRRRQRGAAKRQPANPLAPSSQQQRRDHDRDANRHDCVNAQRRIQPDHHQVPATPALRHPAADMRRM